MELARLRPVLEHPGPVATVYLESRPPSEDAAHQARLRWRAVRESLEAEGAVASALDAVETALGRDPVGEVQADGRVIVAAEEAVLLDEPWDAALGSGDAGYWSQTPQLGSYVREALTAVRLLVAITDQEGARIRREVLGELRSEVDGDQELYSAAESVEGTARAHVHKPREGYLSHARNQRRAEEAVHQNASDIAARLEEVADRFHPDALVLAGPVEGRTAVHQQLSDRLSGLTVEAGRGGDRDDAAEAALAGQLDEIADAIRQRRLETATGEFGHARSQGMTVAGANPVKDAAQQGAVGTVYLDYESLGTAPPSGRRQTDEEDARRPIGAALAAAAGCGASVSLADLPDDAGQDGIAAVVRFAVPTG